MDFDQTEVQRGRPRRQLPTFYYHTHFLEVLDFVGAHYEHVLNAAHRGFIADYRRLPLGAQRLYVRLVNRKGRLFAASRLRYSEIDDLPGALEALRDGGFVRAPDDAHFGDVLRFLTRAELAQALGTEFVGLSRSLKKADYVEFALEHCDPATFIRRLDTRRLFAQGRCDDVAYLLFLYFGRLPDGLSQFTMRDLGIVRTQGFMDEFEPRFGEWEEAQENYYFATRLKRLEQAAPGDLDALQAEASAWPEPVYPAAAKLRDRLAYRLGRRAEREGEPAHALAIYGRSGSPRCSERVVRLLLSAKRRDEAQEFLEHCLDAPRSDEEWLLARDIYERTFRKKRTSTMTDVMRAAQTIDLDETMIDAPERAAAEYFEREGLRAYRTENTLWRTLFGLLFWEPLFAGSGARRHSPFEFLPPSLTDGSFYASQEDAIEARLAGLDDPQATRRAVLKTSTANYGTPNGVFRWQRSTLDAVFALLEQADTQALRTVLRRFCAGYADARHGYPDLMLVDDHGVRFVEIKTEGDQLRRNQLLRLEQLRAAGFRADVVRVRWVLDPDQEYVVVDVETTGGKGDQHRVTEIGAVRVRNGRIVDRFQTLLNPQRSIPAGITRLTGITEAMVADAPYFMDIADRFEAFLGDAIFVAHNVGFDYRFIAREFERLGRPFRPPRLCTCASMRKLYPGHRSYSLAALCRTFDIPLRQHHRALCDAEAAAELLVLINEKRAEQLAEAV